jgi:hypothetical protein
MKAIVHDTVEATADRDSDVWPYAIALAVLGPVALVLSIAMIIALAQ